MAVALLSEGELTVMGTMSTCTGCNAPAPSVGSANVMFIVPSAFVAAATAVGLVGTVGASTCWNRPAPNRMTMRLRASYTGRLRVITVTMLGLLGALYVLCDCGVMPVTMGAAKLKVAEDTDEN